MIRVLVVDDSAVVRRVLTEQLSVFEDIEVVGTAVDPYVARDRIISLRPDVLTLDLEMPRMDGLTFLSKLMKQHPMPVVVLSSLAPKDSENAMTALRLGAIEVLSKPNSSYSTPDIKYLAEVIRAAFRANVRRRTAYPKSNTAAALSWQSIFTNHPDSCQILTIGASTGGTNSIETILRDLPADSPGTLIVQHLPKTFTKAFAERLDRASQLNVKEAIDGDRVVPGIALVAPGDRHMLLESDGSQFRVRIKTGPKVYYQRPSVDVLFYSVAKHAGKNSVGVLLTGMGADGARGLLAMRRAGAKTLAQDEESSVVFGMPKEAIEIGAAEEVVGLEQMTEKILEVIAQD